MTAQLPDASVLGSSPFDPALNGADQVVARSDSAMGSATEPERIGPMTLEEAQSAADFSIVNDNLYDKVLSDPDHNKAPQLYREVATGALQESASRIGDPVRSRLFTEPRRVAIETNASKLQERAAQLNLDKTLQANDGKADELMRQGFASTNETIRKRKIDEAIDLYFSELKSGLTTPEQHRARVDAYRQRYGEAWVEDFRRRDPARLLELLNKAVPMRRVPNVSASERDLMIRTVLGEAGNEPEEGQAAVAHVILTRAKLGNYGGKTVEGVILAPKQFEPWETRRDELLKIDPKSPEYQNAAAIVDDVLSGKRADPTNGATHFYSPAIMAGRGGPPRWVAGNDSQKIGRHIFQRSDDPSGRAQGRGTPADYVPSERLLQHRSQTELLLSAVAADRERAQRVAERNSEEETTRIVEAIIAERPTLKADEIRRNKVLSVDAQGRMIGLMQRGFRPDPPADASRGKLFELLPRVSAPDGDPSKITDPARIDEAYINGDLNKNDFSLLRREFKESNSDDGKRLAPAKAGLINMVRDEITASKPRTADMDMAIGLQLHRLAVDVQNKIDDYRKAGKNPHDLFDRSKPDYLGKPEVVASYQPMLHDRFRASGGVWLPKPRPTQASPR